MKIKIKNATSDDSQMVSTLITDLLLELVPDGEKEIKAAGLDQTTSHLILSGKIIPLLAIRERHPVGVLTLHESAAVYAGGVFGTISELYVVPKYRSAGIGGNLLLAAKKEAARRNWKRLEVGAPVKKEHPGSYKFYLNNGFNEIGPRLRKIIPQN